jgi:hypothetical protein
MAFYCIQGLTLTSVGNTWPITAVALSSLLGYLLWFRPFLLEHLANISQLTFLFPGKKDSILSWIWFPGNCLIGSDCLMLLQVYCKFGSILYWQEAARLVFHIDFFPIKITSHGIFHGYIFGREELTENVIHHLLCFLNGVFMLEGCVRHQYLHFRFTWAARWTNISATATSE